MEQMIESLHQEIQKKEEQILEKNREFSAEISRKNSEIEDLKRVDHSQKFQIDRLETTIQRLLIYRLIFE